ncbi:MAG: Helix-turn-helix domain protein [Methanocella sp. PtaU1.Bin125]|nr:MAG: Helix-turn-helix domain protein [Methanocella sp. PtaU1.Bin125]
MRKLYVALTVAIVALTALIAAGVYANVFTGPGDYVVTPAVPPEETPGAVATDAPAISWWDLPLWVQVASLIDALLILVGLLKLVPFALGRIENVLDNRNRLRIFSYVQSNPGCTPAEITARQHMANGTVKYHVQMLEAEGMIVLRRMGKFTRLFKSASGSDLEKAAVTYMRNETSRNLLQAIMERPGITNSSLAEQFQLDKSSIHWHIERFLKDRMIRFEQDGKYKRYFVSEEAKNVLTKSMTAL